MYVSETFKMIRGKKKSFQGKINEIDLFDQHESNVLHLWISIAVWHLAKKKNDMKNFNSTMLIALIAILVII